jgi:hypothetical protein
MGYLWVLIASILVVTGTKRMWGRLAASAMAATSCAKHNKSPGPVVGVGAGFHATWARWQMGVEFERLGAWYLGTHQRGRV